MTNPYKHPSISTVLDVVEQIPNREGKIEVLRRCKSEALLTVLQGAMDKRIDLKINEPIEYTPAPFGELDGGIYRAVRELAHVGNVNIDYRKRVSIFIGILERVSREDAVLLLQMKDKKLPYPSITPDLVIEAFPGLDLQPVDAYGVTEDGEAPTTFPKSRAKGKGRESKNENAASTPTGEVPAVVEVKPKSKRVKKATAPSE